MTLEPSPPLAEVAVRRGELAARGRQGCSQPPGAHGTGQEAFARDRE